MATTCDPTPVIRAIGQTIGLGVPAQGAPTVAMNSALIEASARIVMAFELPDRVEPAVVFQVD